MSLSFKNHQSGLIDTIVLIVVALIILGYFNIDLKEIFSGPLVEENLRYALLLVIDTFKYLWNLFFAFVQKSIQMI
ncbi:hypothetical protein KW782_00340 [Candidatus Parcubacteria bacterium]|nr:hypothetical protein [Candidatus Parcubacteria bacterium]